MRKTYKWFVASALLAFAACNSNDKKAGEDTNAEEAEAEEICLEFDTIRVSRADSLFSGPQAPSYTILLEAEVATGDSEIAQRFNAAVNALLFHKNSSDINGSMNHVADSVGKAMYKEMEELYDPECGYGRPGYSYNFSGAVVKESAKGYYAYQMNYDLYYGGAHGSYGTEFTNIRMSDGHVMQPNDVFKMEKLQEIQDVMLQQLLVDNDCETKEELVGTTNILMWGELSVKPNNFALTSKGIEFIYNPYEIGCFAIGMVQFTVPYSKLKDYLKIDLK